MAWEKNYSSISCRSICLFSERYISWVSFFNFWNGMIFLVYLNFLHFYLNLRKFCSNTCLWRHSHSRSNTCFCHSWACSSMGWKHKLWTGLDSMRVFEAERCVNCRLLVWSRIMIRNWAHLAAFYVGFHFCFSLIFWIRINCDEICFINELLSFLFRYEFLDCLDQKAPLLDHSYNIYLILHQLPCFG